MVEACFNTLGFSVAIFVAAVVAVAIEFGINSYLSKNKAILGRKVIVAWVIAGFGALVFLLGLFGVGC